MYIHVRILEVLANFLNMQRGNLQDAINAHSINSTHFGEQEMLRLFMGTCEAVRAMHDYRAPIGSKSQPFSRENQSKSAHRGSNKPGRYSEDDEEMFPHPEGDAENGYSYGGSGPSQVPLMTRQSPEEHEVVYDGDEELSHIQQEGANGHADSGTTELVPYAHRDLKPGCVPRGQPYFFYLSLIICWRCVGTS